jgi:hypothetical protein
MHDTRNQVGSIAWRCLTRIPSDSMYLFSPILSKNSGRRVSISSCMCLEPCGTHLSISLRSAAGSNGLEMSNPNSAGSMADTTSGGSGTGEGRVLTPALASRRGRRRRTYSQQASRGRAKRWCWLTLVARPARKGSETCLRQKGKRSVSTRMRGRGVSTSYGTRSLRRSMSCRAAFEGMERRLIGCPGGQQPPYRDRYHAQPATTTSTAQRASTSMKSRRRVVARRHPTHPQNDDAPRSEQTRNPQTRGNRLDHRSPPRTRRTGPSATPPLYRRATFRSSLNSRRRPAR